MSNYFNAAGWITTGGLDGDGFSIAPAGAYGCRGADATGKFPKALRA